MGLGIMSKMPCTTCGVLQGIKELDSEMWSIYHRLKSEKQNIEPLVFDSEWLQENIMDEEDHDSLIHTMEKNMAERGLCPDCGRPNLAGVKEDDLHSEEDMQEMQEMWAEEAAERRAGC
jgi:hypothetical protein